MVVRALKAWLFIGILSCSGWCAQELHSGSSGRQDENLLLRPVAFFVTERLSLPDALLKLGQEQEIPLGIEYLHIEDVRKRITLRVTHTNVGEVVKSILAYGRGYEVVVRDGVLNITHPSVPSDPNKNLLNRVLRKFSVPERTPISSAAGLALRAQLKRALRPPPPARPGAGPVGIAGTSPGDPENVVGPLELRDVTVRQALNRLVKENGNAAWVVIVHPDRLDRIPDSGLWYIINYESPPLPHEELIWGLLRENWPKTATRKVN